MALPNNVSYWWNDTDHLVAQGETIVKDEPFAKLYTTPYGLLPKDVPGAKVLASGTEVSLDLNDTSSPWRARRFKYGLPNWDWQKTPSLPKDVKTLGDLCRHLHNKSSIKYPEGVYGKDYIRTWRAKICITQILFDYWGNSEYRYAVFKDKKTKFDWEDIYRLKPDEIPIRATYAPNGSKTAKTVTIPYVLTYITNPAPLASSKGSTKRKYNITVGDVEQFITVLDALSSRVDVALKVSERTLTHRSRILAAVKQLKALGEACIEPRDLDALDGPKLAAMALTALPHVEEELAAKPIHQPVNLTQSVQHAIKGLPPIQSDVLGELAVVSQVIHHLLFEQKAGLAHVKTLTRWGQLNHQHLSGGIDSVFDDQYGRLCSAINRAARAYGDAAADVADFSFLRECVVRAPSSAARTPVDVKGESAIDVFFTMAGKARTLASQASKVPLTLVGIYGSMKLANVAAGPRTVHYSLTKAEWNRFANVVDEMLDEIPADSELRGKFKKAVRSGSREEITKLHGDWVKEVEKKNAGFSSTYKSAGELLGVVGFVLNLRTLADADSKPDQHATVKFLNFVSDVTGVAEGTLGTAKTVLGTFSSMKSTVETLGKIGTAIGPYSAFLGVTTSTVEFFETCEKGQAGDMTKAWLNTASSIMSAAVVIVGMTPLGAALTGLSLACLLASGAISVDQGSLGKPKTIEYGQALIKGIRQSQLGKYIESVDATIATQFHNIDELLENEATFLPYGPRTTITETSLRNAGFSKKQVETITTPSARLAPGSPF